jgi:hypothetical protein
MTSIRMDAASSSSIYSSLRFMTLIGTDAASSSSGIIMTSIFLLSECKHLRFLLFLNEMATRLTRDASCYLIASREPMLRPLVSFFFVLSQYVHLRSMLNLKVATLCYILSAMYMSEF